jgi:hypothetical protein
LPNSLQQTILERLDTIVQNATDQLYNEFSAQEKQSIAQSAESYGNEPYTRTILTTRDEDFPTSGTDVSQFVSQVQNVFPELLHRIDSEEEPGVNITQESTYSERCSEGLIEEEFSLDEYQTSFVLHECTDGNDPFPQMLSSLGPLGFGLVGTGPLGFSY